MKLPNSDHAIWTIVRMGMLLVFLTAISYRTASNWDETEQRMIAATLFAFGGGDQLLQWFKRDKKDT